MKLRIPSPRKAWKLFKSRIWTFQEPPHIKALSVGVGVAIGFSPFWGLQTLIAIGVVWIFKLNKVLTVSASYITFPPLIPLAIGLQWLMGEWFFPPEGGIPRVYAYALGSVLLSAGTGLLAFLLVWGTLLLRRKRLANR